MGRLILLLGGARSGKSHYAEHVARDWSGPVLFVATAQALDEEMQERIAAHRRSRPAAWHTLEAPLNVAAAIRQAQTPCDLLVLDCVTLLAANVLLTLPEDSPPARAEAAVLAEVDALLALCADSAATWMVISNEVGMGIVPPYRLGRIYRDALGRANQRLAAGAAEVRLLVAGLPWTLKPAAPP
ncbi:MAG: bifunctional adenosylcobinamide kinase/adenosylcobinamide-phosphate guanylyltransferase [Anaerolineae bacterium]|jgi:adenosylcobinamide kinase/adenosylcobinamide-phosphate guanylyltransferase|nr:bifunctional adenosylcobinamide kinase/adenosylcobinamide-phosphate guanylyltransferase [Anaerolineae bacterium]